MKVNLLTSFTMSSTFDVASASLEPLQNTVLTKKNPLSVPYLWNRELLKVLKNTKRIIYMKSINLYALLSLVQTT